MLFNYAFYKWDGASNAISLASVSYSYANVAVFYFFSNSLGAIVVIQGILTLSKHLFYYIVHAIIIIMHEQDTLYYTMCSVGM